ncbi:MULTISPECIES: DUF6192 family protein [unclassified Streptomyces]|uniref:DUF6192 family protein n=1 Tax=unclassified Streptomyces TaxID=2593676 RepID=UPI00225BEF12|nr:DUF6192 family protein [Streptomyces sp. NBC_00569]MCX5441122.1 DUF6192 family protein [Streptomyces sp. NBC_00063]WUB99310.1 DUF6192 family protein [Streptomyces sp. NBC_00569]
MLTGKCFTPAVTRLGYLAQVDEVAAEVSGDLMRRPAVAREFTPEHKARAIEVRSGR